MEVKLDENLRKKLDVFKKIYDTVIEEEAGFNEYINAVSYLGLDRMLRDAIPEGQEWETIRGMFEENPEFISGFVGDVWKKMKEGKKAMRKTKKEVEKVRRYIG